MLDENVEIRGRASEVDVTVELTSKAVRKQRGEDVPTRPQAPRRHRGGPWRAIKDQPKTRPHQGHLHRRHHLPTVRVDRFRRHGRRGFRDC